LPVVIDEGYAAASAGGSTGRSRPNARNPPVRASASRHARGHDGLAMRPTLSVLDPELIDRIVDEALRVLATHGMEIRGAGLRQRLLDAGLPRRDDGRILFPRDAVEEAVRGAPGSFQLYGPDGAPRADLGDDRVHFIPGSSGLKVADHRTGEVRLAQSRDFAEYIRLGDGLPNIP